MSQIGALIFGNVLNCRIFIVKFCAQQVARGGGFLDQDIGEHRVVFDQDIGYRHGIMVALFAKINDGLQSGHVHTVLDSVTLCARQVQQFRLLRGQPPTRDLAFGP